MKSTKLLNLTFGLKNLLMTVLLLFGGTVAIQAQSLTTQPAGGDLEHKEVLEIVEEATASFTEVNEILRPLIEELDNGQVPYSEVEIVIRRYFYVQIIEELYKVDDLPQALTNAYYLSLNRIGQLHGTPLVDMEEILVETVELLD